MGCLPTVLFARVFRPQPKSDLTYNEIFTYTVYVYYNQNVKNQEIKALPMPTAGPTPKSRREEYADAILEDLEWLGFVPDLVAARQSSAERNARYEAALEQLHTAGFVYACDCSRRDIAMDVPDRFGEEMRYPGRCRVRGLSFDSTPARRVFMY